MSRGPIIFGFWLLGYALGFVVYIVRLPIISALYYIFGAANADLVGAIVSGFAGSIVMLAVLFLWSHSGSK